MGKSGRSRSHPRAEPGNEADDGLDHLRVVAVPVDDADNLAQAETSVLDALDPPLTLRGRPPSAIRTRVAHLRAMTAQLASWSRRRERMRSRAGLSGRAAHH